MRWVPPRFWPRILLKNTGLGAKLWEANVAAAARWWLDITEGVPS